MKLLGKFLMVLGALLVAFSAPALAAEKWALLVGVTEYQPPVNKLNGCVNDTNTVRDILIGKAGFRADHIKTLAGASQTTKAAIAAAFKEWLGQAGPDDMVVFFYSGHGAQWDVGGGKIEEVLVPVDVNVQDAHSFILGGELSDWIKTCKAKEFLVMLDACHSGTQVVGSKGLAFTNNVAKTLPRRLQPPNASQVVKQGTGGPLAKELNITGTGKKLTLLAACDTTQTAEDHRFEVGGHEKWNGLFTYAVDKVVSGMDGDKLAQTDYKALMDQVSREVATQMEGQQTPVLQPSARSSEPVFLTQGQPAAASAPPVATLPASEGKLKVYVGQFDGDDGTVARAVAAALRNEPYVELVGGTKDLVAIPSADRTVDGHLSPQLEGVVRSETGAVINTVGGANAGELAARIADEVRRSYTFGWLGQVSNPSAPFRVEVSVNGQASEGADAPTFHVGDKVTFRFKSDHDCYLTLVDVGTSGHVTVLFPNQFHADNFVKAGQVVSIPDGEMGFDIQVQGPLGKEMVKAFATVDKVDITSAIGTKGFKSYKDPAAFRKEFVQGLARAMGVTASASKDLAIVQRVKPDAAPTPPPPSVETHADASTKLQWSEASTVLYIK